MSAALLPGKGVTGCWGIVRRMTIPSSAHSPNFVSSSLAGHCGAACAGEDDIGPLLGTLVPISSAKAAHVQRLTSGRIGVS
ncbi:MAG TPA: hypothetical protein VGO22_19765 [Pseudorhizobium sp.]|nr:hypothetical protein [Pseudorhizobium sp.]